MTIRMNKFAVPVEKLINCFERLPGIGQKSAQRMAFFVLSQPAEYAETFANSLMTAKQNIKECSVCCNLTDLDICPICSEKKRDKTTICVVAEPSDVNAIERTKDYRGVYHVLHGVISPLNQIGPDEINIKELVKRVSTGEISEVIMATNPDTTGEATALYIARLLRPFGVKTTRLAYGIAVGSNLEFTDEITLLRAMDGRKEL